MRIDKLRLEDMPEVAALYDELAPMKKNDPAVCSERYRSMMDRDDLVVLAAREDGRMIGTAMGILCPSLLFGGKPFLVIEDVIVTEKCRGRGVGRALLDALDELALENGCSYAILVSSGFRAGAHAFYQKLGFTDDVRGFRKGY